MKISTLYLLLAFGGVFSVFLLWYDSTAAAQDSKGEPVYLEMGRQPPPARDVRPHKIEKKYEDEETVRLKLQVMRLSDDTFVNDGPYAEFYPNGQKYQEGTYKRGVYDGEWTYWYPNGQLCKTIAFIKGKPDGEWEVYRSDGTKREFQSYKNGVRNGKWLTYYPDGETPLVEVTFEAGQISGPRIAYHSNGKKREEIEFKDGKMHGKMAAWDNTGKKLLEAEFEEGKRKGDVIRY